MCSIVPLRVRIRSPMNLRAASCRASASVPQTRCASTLQAAPRRWAASTSSVKLRPATWLTLLCSTATSPRAMQARSRAQRSRPPTWRASGYSSAHKRFDAGGRRLISTEKSNLAVLYCKLWRCRAVQFVRSGDNSRFRAVQAAGGLRSRARAVCARTRFVPQDGPYHR